MTDPTAETDALADRLETIRLTLAAVATDRPTPEQIAEWNTADKEMAQRVRAALPGVPLHHVYAVLRASRTLQRMDAAAAGPAAPSRVDLVEVAAQAIRDSNGTPEALEWWRTHPQLIPAHVYAAAVLAVLPPAVDRAAVLREAADAVFALDYDVMVGEVGDENFGSMREAWDVGTIHATELLRRLADEAQQPTPVAASEPRANETGGTVAEGQQQPDTETRTPCDQPNACDPDTGELCATHEEEQAHAEGEHEYCGVTCEVAMPTELMRNSLIAWLPPGGKGMLAELERRAAASAPAVPVQPAADGSSKEAQFGVPGCTCKPWTVEHGERRFMEPGETVDRISGWHAHPDCPHHGGKEAGA